MSKSFLNSVPSDAVTAFVQAKVEGKSDSTAAGEAKKKLTGQLLAAFDGSGAKWKPLALPLADLVEDGDGLVVPLLDPNVNTTASSSGWDWEFKAGASMRLTADVLDAAQLALLGVTARDGFQVVRYAVEGGLEAAASGGTQAGVWSLKVGASASLKSAIEWYVAGRQQDYLGVALIKALPFMAAPMSLGDQLARAGDPEYWGSTTEFGGTATASFSADASLAKTGWTWGFDGDKAKLVFTLGASVGASVKIDGNFRLRCIVKEAGVQPQGNGKRYGLEVTLERLSTSEKSFAASVSAGLDASALAQSADKWLRASLKDPDSLLDALTNPGTVIADKLQAALEKGLGDSKFKDVVLLAAGYGDQEALAAKLAKRATGSLADEIDKLGDAVLGGIAKADGFVDRWLDRVFGEIELPAALKTKLADLAGKQVDKAKDEAQGAFDKLVGKLDAKTKAAAAEVLKPFGVLGEKIQANLQSAANAISKNEAVQAVKAGLAEYAALREKVLAALSDAQRAKIGIAFSGSWVHTEKSQTFFRATFVPGGDLSGAERLYQALWSGRFEDIRALVSEARGAIHGEPEGWLLVADKLVGRQGVDINLFGISLSEAMTKISELELKVDLAGNVLGAAKASAQGDTVNYWRERHALLALSATRTVEDSGASVQVGFNGAYSAAGNEISAEFLEGMQRTLARVTGGSGSVDVRKLLNAPDAGSTAGKAFFKDASFVLPIAVTHDEFQVFLAADPLALRSTIVNYGMRALDAEEDGRWDEAPSRFLMRLAAALTGTYASDLDRAIAYLDRFPSRWRLDPTDMDNIVYERLGLDPHDMKKGSRLHAQLGPLFRLAKMMRAIVDLQRTTRALRDVMVTMRADDLAGAQSAASAHLRAISDALAAFAISSVTLIGNKEMVSWPFATFAAAFAEAAGRAVPPGFTSCVVLPGSKDAIPLIPT